MGDAYGLWECGVPKDSSWFQCCEPPSATLTANLGFQAVLPPAIIHSASCVCCWHLPQSQEVLGLVSHPGRRAMLLYTRQGELLRVTLTPTIPMFPSQPGLLPSGTAVPCPFQPLCHLSGVCNAGQHIHHIPRCPRSITTNLTIPAHTLRHT